MDPIAQMLNSIRNAQVVAKKSVVVPFSKFKYSLAQVLSEAGLVSEVEKKGRASQKTLEITLKYAEGNRPLISGFQKISRSSQRIYSPFRQIRSRRGTVIVSTSKGLMTAQRAKKEKLGGEVICEVW